MEISNEGLQVAGKDQGPHAVQPPPLPCQPLLLPFLFRGYFGGERGAPRPVLEGGFGGEGWGWGGVVQAGGGGGYTLDIATNPMVSKTLGQNRLR